METKPLEHSAARYLPPRVSLSSLRVAAAVCQGCDLYKQGRQTVFGEGAAEARVMLIGEVPGAQEDKQGRPFIGPAGRLLRRALADAGIDSGCVYITNAVKHFKSIAVGGRRKGVPPNRLEIQACRPWLEAELKVVRPRVVMCLGATAAHSVLGRLVRIKDVRGALIDNTFGVDAYITTHPSALLRAGQVDDMAREYQRFVTDLRRLRSYCADRFEVSSQHPW